jgi:mono/diheme cytochrome c family protein
MNRALAGATIALLSLVARGAIAAESPPQWDAPAEAKQLQNPVKMDPRTVERGSRLYKQHCLPCHGADGAGDGVMAKKLGYKPADLTLLRLGQQVDGELFWKISKGRKPMPDFEKDFSPRERWDLVSYIRTLLKQVP